MGKIVTVVAIDKQGMSIARHGNRGQTNYVATKAALAANTVTWSREFARFGIRVGAVAPSRMVAGPVAGSWAASWVMMVGMTARADWRGPNVLNGRTTVTGVPNERP